MSHAKAQSLQQHYTGALAPRYGTLEHVKGRAMWRCHGRSYSCGSSRMYLVHKVECNKLLRTRELNMYPRRPTVPAGVNLKACL